MNVCTNFITSLLSVFLVIMKKGLLFLTCCWLSITAFSQPLFPDQCIGKWSGMMQIWQRGELKDSVKVEFTVARLSDSSWQWRMDYLSPARPMTKDYVLRKKSATRFVTDEGDGIELDEFVFGNKMYCLFKVGGSTLTAVYELLGNGEMLFEVTSAGAPTPTGSGVENFPVTSVQKVLLRRVR
jgi:hypothetical protein